MKGTRMANNGREKKKKMNTKWWADNGAETDAQNGTRKQKLIGDQDKEATDVKIKL